MAIRDLQTLFIEAEAQVSEMPKRSIDACYHLPEKCECGKALRLEIERLNKLNSVSYYQKNLDELAIAHKHIQDMQVTNGSLTAEVDRLKLGLEQQIECQVEVEVDRNHWKSVAGKLKEALEKMMEDSEGMRGEYSDLEDAMEQAKAALAQYNASRGDEGKK